MLNGNRLWLLGGMVLLSGCGGHEAANPEEADLPTVEVRLGEVETRTIMRTHPLPGTVHPSDQAIIASKVMATIESVDVAIGETVEENQLLILLDAGEIRAQVEQAEAQLSQLERNYEREQALYEQSATTKEAVRTLEDEIRLARARLEEARTMASYTRIRAPFDGIVTSKQVRRGDLASPGVPLLTVEGKGNLEVHVQVPDSLLVVPYGEELEIETGGETFHGKLSEWSPAADPASRTRLAKLQLPEDTSLRSGQYVRVNWPAEEISALWVPANATSRMGQLERVYLHEAGRLEMLLVRTGEKRDNQLRVLAGLNAGDEVVLEPADHLKDGQPATILP